MYTNTILILIFNLLSFNVSAQVPSNTWQFLPYKKYNAPKCVDSIQMDGFAYEKSWANAAWSDLFMDIEGDGLKNPYYQTKVKILWNDTYIYFFAELQEKHIWAKHQQRDTIVYFDNDFEIFLKPYTNSPQYCELEVNCLGTVWDLFLANTYREGGPVLNNWNIENLQVAISTKGSINNPTDKDTSWSVEIAIPWTALRELKFNRLPEKQPEPWRINFSRVQWEHDVINNSYSRKLDSSGKLLAEHNWVWSPQGVVNMHQPENWGVVYFSEECTKLGPTFSEEEILTQALFHLYRLEEIQLQTQLKLEMNLNLLESNQFKINELIYIPKLTPTLFGYEIEFDSKETNFKYVINEQGILKRILNQ